MRRGRENLFEELGRVEGERSNRNRRAEISRVHGELNRGYKKGGRTVLNMVVRLAQFFQEKKSVFRNTNESIKKIVELPVRGEGRRTSSFRNCCRRINS